VVAGANPRQALTGCPAATDTNSRMRSHSKNSTPLTTFRMPFVIILLVSVSLALGRASAADSRPNVIVILADDLGYGDPGCYNPQSKIPTPHIDRLAAEGIRFTDAHTPSAVCTPTRYGLMTGRYAWRTWLKSGVLDGFDPPLIEADRVTLASFLKAQGFATACIGKWHLGMTWTGDDGKPVAYRGNPTSGFRPGSDVDFTRPIEGGPRDRGFDLFFGIAASLDMSPYSFIEDRRTLPPPRLAAPESKTLFLNQAAGVRSEGFTLEGVLPALKQRAQDFIRSRAGKAEPFLLYLPLSSPHLPIVPNGDWIGKSAAGLYGDFVAETDGVVGDILRALDAAKLRDNTLVIFTSDNGGLWHRWEAEEADDVAGYKSTPRGNYTGERAHRSNAALRGTKADIHEGGHRVPFIVRWPARVRAGGTSAALVELNDVFATVAEITRVPLPSGVAGDSFSFLPEITGSKPATPVRTFAVHHSLTGVFALREGPWKFVPARGSGGFSLPRTVSAKAGEPIGQLYHLGDDPGETRNVWMQHPRVVKRMAEKLAAVQMATQTR